MMFLEISQNSQENTCAQACNFIKKETLEQVFSCEFCEISKNIFSYRTPPVDASVQKLTLLKKEQKLRETNTVTNKCNKCEINPRVYLFLCIVCIGCIGRLTK